MWYDVWLLLRWHGELPASAGHHLSHLSTNLELGMLHSGTRYERFIFHAEVLQLLPYSQSSPQAISMSSCNEVGCLPKSNKQPPSAAL